MDDSRHLGGGYLGEEDRSHQAHRHPHKDGSGSAGKGGEDNGENAEVIGGCVPAGAEEEVDGTDLQNGRHAGDDQIDADDQHKGHRNHAAGKKQQIHSPLQGFMSNLGPGSRTLFVNGARAIYDCCLQRRLCDFTDDFMFHEDSPLSSGAAPLESGCILKLPEGFRPLSDTP